LSLGSKYRNRDFSWTSDFNISFNRNKVLQLGTNNTPIGGIGEQGFTSYWKTEVGRQMPLFYGYVFDGIYMTQEDFDASAKHITSAVGTTKMRDLNDDGVITSEDKTFIGNPNPKFIFGFNNGFTYKNVDLNIVLSGAYGGDVFAFRGWHTILDGNFNVIKELKDRWRSVENPGKGFHARTLSNTTAFGRFTSSKWIHNASYLTVKNITLGYTVPQAIEADLQDAIRQLPVVSFPQSGRVTKGAAQTLLGDVYITQGKFAQAEPVLKEVTQMDYGLMADYADAFDINSKNSKESIFEIQYQEGNQGQQSDFLYPFLPLSSDVSLITGITSQNRNAGGWNVPTEDLLSAYEPNDQRLEASVAIAEGTGPVGAMVIEEVKGPRGYSTPSGKRSYAFIKKYLHPHSIQNNTDNNFPVYRYSDVLLLLAESLNEQGKSNEALEYLNPVRERAGLHPVELVDQNQLREIILHERRIEFAFENKRWLDLVRTGKAVEVMSKHGEELKAEFQHLNTLSYRV